MKTVFCRERLPTHVCRIWMACAFLLPSAACNKSSSCRRQLRQARHQLLRFTRLPSTGSMPSDGFFNFTAQAT